MKLSEWVVDRFPKPYETVIIDDIYEGVYIGYYDISTNSFVSDIGVRLNDARAWMKIPERVESISTIKYNIQNKNLTLKGFINTIE